MTGLDARDHFICARAALESVGEKDEYRETDAPACTLVADSDLVFTTLDDTLRWQLAEAEGGCKLTFDNIVAHPEHAPPTPPRASTSISSNSPHFSITEPTGYSDTRCHPRTNSSTTTGPLPSP